MAAGVTARERHAQAIEAVWRIESARLIGGLVRVVRDVGLAEDLAQDALVAALERWPATGIPDNPGAWLMATAKNRAIDQLRRRAAAGAQARRASRTRPRPGRAAARPRGGARRGRRRRPPAARPHRLPPGPLDGGARRAHAAPARRAHHRGDRPRLPRARADHRAAHRARQADARRGARAVRGAARARSSPRGSPRCSRSSTSSSTRATPRRAATTGCAPSSARTRCASGASSPQLVPERGRRCTASSRSWSSRRRAPARASAPSGEPILLLDQDRSRWDQLLIRRGLAALARAEALGAAARPVRAAGRDRRLPRARAHRPTRPTGSGSSRSTTRSSSSRRRRSSSSIAPSPSPWRSGRRRGSSSSTRSPTSRRSRSYHLLPSVRGDLLREARPARRGARRVRACRGARPERARAGAAAGPRQDLCRGDEREETQAGVTGQGR